MGLQGHDLTGYMGIHSVTDTVANTFPTGRIAFAITPIEDTVIETITYSSGFSDTGDGITGITLPAGLTVYVRATAVKLTSGKILAYLTTP
jgi:hypothetical protein